MQQNNTSCPPSFAVTNPNQPFFSSFASSSFPLFSINPISNVQHIIINMNESAVFALFNDRNPFSFFEQTHWQIVSPLRSHMDPVLPMEYRVLPSYVLLY